VVGLEWYPCCRQKHNFLFFNYHNDARCNKNNVFTLFEVLTTPFVAGITLLQTMNSENCALLGCYAASSGNFVPAFRDNSSVPSSGFNPQAVPKRR